jgi:hypothetical protein
MIMTLIETRGATTAAAHSGSIGVIFQLGLLSVWLTRVMGVPSLVE